MSRVSKKITNWLYSVLQPQYENPEITYQDVYRFLSVYLDQGFKIRTAVYTSALGGSDLLVNIYGPVSCANNIFQIEIWIPVNYPYPDLGERSSNVKANGVPIAYVIPPKGFCIRPGNNVDSQGQIYHPFLVDWFKTMRPGQPADSFNLTSLMSYVVATFERNCPIGLLPETTGPALPPKPYSGIVSPQQTGQRKLADGPPLPQKGSLSSDPIRPIPQKYMAPPPLPGQIQQNNWGSADSHISQSTQNAPFTPIFARPNEVEHNWSTGRQSLPVSPPNQYIQPVQDVGKSQTSGSPKPGRKPPGENIVPDVSTIEDLMDQVTIESRKDNSNPVELQRIAHFINMHLDSNNPQSVNGLIPRINELKNKATALYSQLMHHNTQAKANAENLDHHVDYLTKQVSSVEQSNQQLHQLSEINRNSEEQVFLDTSGERKVAIEDLILPDSALVRQLYDTIAEINGYKDAIKLVGGSYKSEPELINDDTLDSCVRSVRALSRELFWLEVTKNEIAKVMGLQV